VATNLYCPECGARAKVRVNPWDGGYIAIIDCRRSREHPELGIVDTTKRNARKRAKKFWRRMMEKSQ
jgi:hypothetical protein